MTSTPVADVSSYFANFASAKATGSGMDTANNFNDVLKQQTDNSLKDTQSPVTRTKTERTAPDRINGKESPVKPERGSSLEQKTELSEEEMNQAVEEAVAQMLVKTAEELNLTVDQVTDLLKELGLETTDLLNPDTIPVLVLKAAGTQDALELVTNQELYHTVQALNEEVQALNENLAQKTGISKEELVQILKNLSEVKAENGLEMQDVENAQETVQTDAHEEAKPAQVRTAVSEQTAENEEETPKIVITRHTASEERNTGGNTPQQGTHPFAQQLDMANEVPNPVMTADETFAAGQSNRIMNQILDYMKISFQPEMTDIQMQLHPESLGKVNVHISSKEGVITAQFTAQNETVKTVLESQMIQLKESFTQQGLKVEAVEVAVDNHSFERSMSQNEQPGESGREAKKSHTRKLQMDALESVEIEELSEEEQMAVRLMKQNGNTVDYTA